MRELSFGILKKFSADTKRRIILVTGALSLALIFLSGFLPLDNKSEESTGADPPQETFTSDDYRKELEGELEGIISKIDGAGSVEILITMESTAEDIYAADRSESTSADAVHSEQNEYVIIKGRDGSEQTVLKKQRMPEIRGVLVVCEGGDSSVIREKITAAVAGALGIARGKVVVVQ